MRVLQVIDSLNAGGAEKMAVNYANALSVDIDYSGIVVTRKEGVLQNMIKKNVPYYFLNKKKSIDFKAILLLKKIINDNNVTILHAHGTSFFTAFLVKIICPKIKIIFHEHFGERANQKFYNNLPLLFCCLFFSKIIVVNHQIKLWFNSFGFKKVYFLPNFATFNNSNQKTILHGIDGKRIICLANLKHPKNHMLLLDAFSKIENHDWTLHFVGQQYNDNYLVEINHFIEKNNEKNVFLYNSKTDIENILAQASIGILCSTSEGFPVTLLEYGLMKLAVITSNVGYNNQIIHHNKTGFLFESNNVNELQEVLEKTMANHEIRATLSAGLHTFVTANFSQQKVITMLIEMYNKA